MKTTEEMLDHLHNEIDSALHTFEPSQQLKQGVLSKINKEHYSQKNHIMSMHKASAVVVGIFILIALLQIPIINAQVPATLIKLSLWLQEAAHIPVKIPGSWDADIDKDSASSIVNEPDIEEASALEQEAQNSSITENDRKYIYFEVTRSDDSYSMTTYRVKTPIPVNDRASLLEKNGPVSQSDVIGSISGEKVTDNHMADRQVFSVPSHYTEFDLMPNVKAFRDDIGCNVVWEQSNWVISYLGPSNGIDRHLKRLASQWTNIPTAIKELNGSISIVEGNKLQTNVSWEQGGVAYTYSTPDDNFEAVIQILSGFIDNKINNVE